MNVKHLLIIVIILLISTTGIASVIALNDTSGVKTVKFDDIKVNVPKDADFEQVGAGWQNEKYGIEIKTFASNESIATFLSQFTNGTVVHVDDQPANSVAFDYDGKTNILITNGRQAICVNAFDQGVSIEMANSVVFPDGEHVKRDHGFGGIGKKTLHHDEDFNLMLALMEQINTEMFNLAVFEQTIDVEDNSSSVNYFDIGTDNESADGDVLDNTTEVSDSNVQDTNDALESFNAISEDIAANEENGAAGGDVEGDVVADNGDVLGDSQQGDDESQLLYSQSDCEKAVQDYLNMNNFEYGQIILNSGDDYSYTFEIRDIEDNPLGYLTVDAATLDVDSSNFMG